MTVPAPSPTRKLAIPVVPVHTVFMHVHCVADATVSARSRSAVGAPVTLKSNVEMLAFDWLDVPAPDVFTVDAPAVRMPGMFAEALATLIDPPALGSGPVSETALVTPGPAPVMT